MRSVRESRIGERDWWTFGTGHRKWFTAGDASRGEAKRGDTRSAARSSARGLRARFPLVSFLSLSLFLRSSLPITRNLFSSLLSLSLFLSPRRGSRLKTRSKSRRRVASSRFGDSKEGSFLFPSLCRYFALHPTLAHSAFLFRVLSRWRCRSQRSP